MQVEQQSHLPAGGGPAFLPDELAGCALLPISWSLAFFVFSAQAPLHMAVSGLKE